MSWYNLNGTVTEVTGLEDLYFHDTLRIPNWPTQSAASQHKYTLNTAQNAAVIAAGIQIDSTGGGVSASPVTGGASATTQAQVAAAGASGLVPSFSLVFGNTKGLLIRMLKIGFGGVLLIAGIMRLTGADKDIIQIAGASMKGMV